MSELHPISDICKDPQRKQTRKADVVFVHGLMGHPFGTWRYGDDEATSWPHWLAKEREDIGVWSLEYDALPSRWLMRADGGNGHSMPIIRRATEVMNLLALTLGKPRPLIFVCHSLGGLLVKEMIWQASDSSDPKCKALCERTFAVMFLATPHQGADMAKVVGKLSLLLRPSDNIRDLEANSPQLGKLYDWYREHSQNKHDIRTHTFYETEKTGGVWLVDATTAHPGVGPVPIAQEVDHIAISKPKKPGDLVCLTLSNLIEDALQAPVADPPLPSGMRHGASTFDPKGFDLQPATPCQLPQAASKFFGRAEALNTLIERLRGGAKNTVIVGPAGFGKTALVAEALRRLLGEPPEPGLASTHFPHGIVFVDFYLHRGQADGAWQHIADSVCGANFNPQWKPQQRAAEACRGRSLLLIVEGAEEADGSIDGSSMHGAGQRTTRRQFIEPLRWEGRIVWLTRPMPQSPADADIELEMPLEAQEAAELFDHLTGRVRTPIPNDRREALLEVLERHPLAITWACGQLMAKKGGQLDALIEELRRQPTLTLKDREQHRHTLQWLFQRSLRGASDALRRSLAAAGLLANTPLPLAAFQAATGLDTDAQRAALSEAEERGLLSYGASSNNDDAWGFSHVLGYHFSRALAEDDAELLGADAVARLAGWVHQALTQQLVHAQPTNTLSHATALLAAATPPIACGLLWNGLLYDLSDRLKDLGRLSESRAALNAVEAWWQRLPEVLQTTDGFQRESSVIHNRLGDLLQVQGDLAGAQQRYEAGLRISDALAQRDPDNAGWQRDLSVSHDKLGDLLQLQGDLAGAQQRYEASQRIRDTLAQRDPDHAGWQRDLSVSFEKLGHLLQVQGDLAGARQRYEASLRISDTLAKRDPDHAGWQRDLSVSLEKLGNLLQVQGDLAGAQQRYEASLRIRDTLAQRDPYNAEWQRDLSVSHTKLGDLLQVQGDLASAKQRYEASLRIRDTLAQRDPDHAGWQRDLSISFDRLGDLLQVQGDLAGAQQRYEASLRIRDTLAKRDPDNAGWQRDWALSLIRLGIVRGEQGDVAAVRSDWQQAHAIFERLVQRLPEHPQFRRELARFQEMLASLEAE